MHARKPVVNTLEAAATLVGTAIGAGVLGLPYAISKAGFGIGIAMLLGLGWINIILQTMFAEVTLRTQGQHQIPGYAGTYLGSWAKKLASFVGLSAGYGVLLAYMIAIGQILSSLLGGPSDVVWSLIYFIGISFVIFRGLDTIKIMEVIMSALVAALMLLIWTVSIPHVKPIHLFTLNFQGIPYVYGVLLFALSATVSIPEVRQELVGQEKKFPMVIIIANLFVIIIYTFFTLFVLGVTGTSVTEVATLGLGNAIGEWISILGNILAFFTITTSCLTIGLAVRRVYQYDYSFSRHKALFLTLAPPLLIFLSGFHDFIKVLGIVGGIGLGLQGSIVVCAFWKARKHDARTPEFSLGSYRIIGAVMLFIFILGAIITLRSI